MQPLVYKHKYTQIPSIFVKQTYWNKIFVQESTKFHFTDPGLKMSSRSGERRRPSGGLISSCCVQSCAHAFYLLWLVRPSCWTSAESLTLEPHTESSPSRSMTPITLLHVFAPRMRKKKQTDNCAHLQSTRGNSQKAVGTASCAAPPVFISSVILTSSCVFFF